MLYFRQKNAIPIRYGAELVFLNFQGNGQKVNFLGGHVRCTKSVARRQRSI